MVELLLEKKADVDAKDRSGFSPLRYAAEEGREAVVKLLAENGAEIHAKEGSLRQTSLHHAARCGCKAVVKAAARYGCGYG